MFGLYGKLFEIINASIPTPDLLVYLYLKVDKLKANIKMRGRDYEQSIAEEYLESIQQGYFEFLRQQQNMRILILDTNNIDFVKNPDDYQKIMHHINQEYSIGIHRRVL